MFATNNPAVCDSSRYDRLIKAEQDANYLKALLAEKFENYETFSREELKILYTMFIGKEEE